MRPLSRRLTHLTSPLPPASRVSAAPVGNEADVTLYVNATGLMWENAASMGASIIFAEVRA